MSSPDATRSQTSVPLCVDLDGTLIRSDLLWESFLRLVKQNPLSGIAALFWWMRGRANLKARIADRVGVDPASLPYHEAFLDYLRSQKRAGRKLLLVTASEGRLARQVADHVGIFDEVLASDGRTNLRGGNKAAALVARFGERGFDYAGNSSVDLPVWAKSREALVVNARRSLADQAARSTSLGPCFLDSGSRATAVFQELRPHQWVKNLILLVPLLTSHRLTQVAPLLTTLWAFLSFCLCASAVYVLNDLLDLDVDRHHPAKRARPFAAGDLPLSLGLIAFPVLLAGGLAMGCALSWRFLAVLGVYLFLALGYSWRWKQIALLDVFCLAGLYTIRLIAGHEAASVVYSVWLLVFSMFIFLSLALVKRFVELEAARQQNRESIKGRGYAASDLELVASLGSTSGYLAALVLALYVNSQEVRALYGTPILLLLICPLLLYWISRVWLLAHRGQMHGDPIVFALKDRVSYIVGVLTLVILWLATVR